jgi:hypothetical protein
MSTDYKINERDVEESAILLRDVLTTRSQQRGTDNDYSEGSVLGSTLIDGHATVFALLRNQIREIKNRLSLRDIQKLPDTESVRDAADAILSNFYRTRKQGRFAKGVATLHFTQRVDALIPRRTRFFKTPQLVFYIDSDADILISANSLRPNIDASGRVIDYVTQVNLTAARVGKAYNQPAGRFVAVDPFSPFFSYAENVTAFAFGDDLQSTAEFIATSENALSLRAIVNARSNDALLRGELFPEIQTLLTVNYGDPEMQRDIASDPATGVELHVGGHADIYIRLQTQEVVERVVVQDLTPRPDGLVTILRDPAPPTGSFITAGVVPGDILVLVSGTPNAPFQYVVREVRATELEISSRVPFEIATDEQTPVPAIAYTVGNNYPAFNNKVIHGPLNTITTSRRIAEFNRAMLPGVPVYRVKQVEVLNAPPALDPYRDPVTGNVVFTNRLNSSVVNTPTPGTALGFRVICKNPLEAQSQRAVTLIEIGWPAFNFGGLTLEVTYETLAGFGPIANYVKDDFNRTLGANPLVRAFHPVYLSFSLPYRARIVPRNTLDVFNANGTFTVNTEAVQRAIIDYIVKTPFGTRPDTGGIGQAAKNADSNIAATYPFTIKYELLAPDGRVYRYATDDIVSVVPDGVTTSARLLNPADFGLPTTGYYAALARQLVRQGVSDRTVRYLAVADQVALEQRGV